MQTQVTALSTWPYKYAEGSLEVSSHSNLLQVPIYHGHIALYLIMYVDSVAYVYRTDKGAANSASSRVTSTCGSGLSSSSLRFLCLICDTVLGFLLMYFYLSLIINKKASQARIEL